MYVTSIFSSDAGMIASPSTRSHTVTFVAKSMIVMKSLDWECVEYIKTNRKDWKSVIVLIKACKLVYYASLAMLMFNVGQFLSAPFPLCR